MFHLHLLLVDTIFHRQTLAQSFSWHRKAVNHLFQLLSPAWMSSHTDNTQSNIAHIQTIPTHPVQYHMETMPSLLSLPLPLDLFMTSLNWQLKSLENITVQNTGSIADGSCYIIALKNYGGRHWWVALYHCWSCYIIALKNYGGGQLTTVVGTDGSRQIQPLIHTTDTVLGSSLWGLRPKHLFHLVVEQIFISLILALQSGAHSISVFRGPSIHPTHTFWAFKSVAVCGSLRHCFLMGPSFSFSLDTRAKKTTERGFKKKASNTQKK